MGNLTIDVMVLNRLKSLFNFQPARTNSVVTFEPPTEQPGNSAPSIAVQNIYPPEDQGLPLREIEGLVAGNQSLISRIKLHAASEEDRFNLRYLDPIRRLAEHINTLPGSASSLFSGEGGLLRASLELAFLSFQASDGRIFTGAATVEARHKLEPRWRYICFAAGLLYPIGVPLSRMAVASKSGNTWQKHQYGVSEWATRASAQRLYVSWPDEGSAALKEVLGPSPYTAAIIGKIFGPENLTWLEDGSPDLTRTLFELVGGSETQSKIAREVIETMWNKVKVREEARRPQTYGRLVVGTHLPPYLVGAMKTMVEEGVWVPGSLPLLADSTGVYLVWPQAGEDIVGQGNKEGRDGWPSAASTLAELLKQAGIFDTSRGNDLGMTEVVDQSGNLHAAFKLRNPNAVIEDYSPSTYSKSAPKTLEGVLENDPILKRNAKPKPAPAPAPVEEASTSTSEDAIEDTVESTDPETGEIYSGTAQVQPDAADTAGRAPIDELPLQKPALEPAPAVVARSEEAEPRIKEVSEVKFSDLVPEEVRKEMRTPLAIEILGKVIKAWRERGHQSQNMRMTDVGAAISVQFLTGMMRSLPDWVNEIGEVGLVYAPPSTPGLKIQKVAIPEGAKPRDSIVISRYGCKKLGLS